MGVGGQGSVTTPLVERWDGTTWAALAAPNPPHQYAAYLTSVSCLSETSCVAIGVEDPDPSVWVPFAETWDGSAWTLTALPAPGSFAEVTGLSCTTSGYCMAAGYYQANSASGSFADVRIAGRWVPVAAPVGGVVGGLSCGSTTFCIAIADSPGSAAAFVEQWNGRQWRTATTATGGMMGDFADVSCASDRACVVVGVAGSSRGGVVTLTWDGSRWHDESVPALETGITADDVVGVNCATATSCLLVGTAYGAPSAASVRTTLFADRWDGRQWLAMPVPVSISPGFLKDISCVQPDYCMTVGTVSDLWNGSSWRMTLRSEVSMTSVLVDGQPLRYWGGLTG